MANLRQTIAIGSTGSTLVSAFTGNAINANIRVYNVEDYGAVHDGVTDDTVAIQATINACDTNGGGDVYFPNGVYIIAGVLQTNVDGVLYNSQIYIPTHHFGLNNISIRLIGESFQWINVYDQNIGVILRPTIAGCAGLNDTTGKLEFYDGSNWHDLY